MALRVSIIIPSRDRASYLEHSLKTVTRIDDADIEILVSDNASEDHTRDVVNAAKDARVRYVNPGSRVSMRQNFEFAVRQSTGDYVITFGDDDGMIPGQFPVLRHILEAEKPDTLSWDFQTFGWPIEGYGTKTGGVRLARDACFGTPFQIDAKLRLHQLEQGHKSNEIPLPNLYHGCMSRAYMDRLSGPDVPYFRAKSPDLYISFRALQHGGNFWHVHHPLSINGFSPASTGGSMNNLNKNSKKTDSKFLTEAKLDDVDDIIPITKSMALAFLGTLETAHHLYPEDPVSPDYLAWYRQALLDVSRKDAETAAEIQASLDGHAQQFGAEDILSQARKLGAPQGNRIKEKIKRNLMKINSFRRASDISGENTIATAAQMCDDIFGSDAMAVVQGQMSAQKAWKNSKSRSQKYPKQI